MTIEKMPFGELADGRTADLFTLTGDGGLRVRVCTFGALLVGVEAPDRDGESAEVTLGFDTLAGWLANSPYFGATVGRYANRIAGARFTLDGTEYTLAANDGRNHLHGGVRGFNKVLWRAEADGRAVRMTYRSADGEEGYPGNLDAAVVYRLGEGGELAIEFSAVTDAPTVVNLCNHAYWNLGGHDSGDVLNHVLRLEADAFTAVDDELIPTGELTPVAGTALDFTHARAVGDRIVEAGGYDHNFVLRGAPGSVRPAARLRDPASGRVMEVRTDQPGVQLYTGNFLDGVPGRGGAVYGKHAGLCLETQRWPDSPNRPDFPSAELRPGETYRHTVVHRFSAE